MRDLKRYLIALVVLPLMALFTGCDVTPQVERAIERELPGVIGPAEHYDVAITGLNVRRGTAERVDIRGERVAPEDSPVLDVLDLQLLRVRYDLRAERLESIDSAFAAVEVLPSDLGIFLRDNRNIREANVTLAEPDLARVQLRPEVAGFALPAGVIADVQGRLRAVEGQIHFEIEEVRAAGARLGAPVIRQISQAINPLVDLTETDAALYITSVEVRDGRLLARAEAEPAALVLR